MHLLPVGVMAFCDVANGGVGVQRSVAEFTPLPFVLSVFCCFCCMMCTWVVSMVLVMISTVMVPRQGQCHSV